MVVRAGFRRAEAGRSEKGGVRSELDMACGFRRSIASQVRSPKQAERGLRETGDPKRISNCGGSLTGRVLFISAASFPFSRGAEASHVEGQE